MESGPKSLVKSSTSHSAHPTAISAGPTGSAKLAGDDFPVQQSVTVIEIRPFRGDWQCFEAPGVQPYWTGKNAKESAIGYAQARAKFGRGEVAC